MVSEMHKNDRANDRSSQLERWEYRNPEQVAMRRQAQSCHRCKHEEKLHLGNERSGLQLVTYCAKGRKHGKRCVLYQPKLTQGV